MDARTREAWREAAARGPVLDGVHPVERLRFASELVCIGSFRCATDHALFPGGTPSTSCCFVFPRSSVFLQHEGSRRFLSDPTLVTFHNRGRVYRRFRASEQGDRADWFAIAPAVLLEAVAERDPRVAESPGRPFRFEWGPSDAGAYLEQRRLFELLGTQAAPDALAVEEGVFDLLDQVVERACAAHGVRARRPRGDRDCAERARAILAGSFRGPVSLSALAAETGVSVSHLCRSFRSHHGRTLSAHREQLRLRASLERVAAGDDLSAVACELGFSSHSHFSARFRRAFGLTPSALRGRRLPSELR
jgi:AraC-like DNA-binding protein